MDKRIETGLPPEKDYWSIVSKAFEEEVISNGYQMKLSDGIYDVYDNGFVIYTLDFNTLVYKKRYYNKFVNSDRVSNLESILYKHFGWGAPGSTKIKKEIGL